MLSEQGRKTIEDFEYFLAQAKARNVTSFAIGVKNDESGDVAEYLREKLPQEDADQIDFNDEFVFYN